MSTHVVGERPPLEVADVIRSHGEAFISKYGKHLSDVQKKTLRVLALCRTAALGGHVETCIDCGEERFTRRVLAKPSVPQAKANSHDRRNNTS